MATDKMKAARDVIDEYGGADTARSVARLHPDTRIGSLMLAGIEAATAEPAEHQTQLEARCRDLEAKVARQGEEISGLLSAKASLRAELAKARRHWLTPGVRVMQKGETDCMRACLATLFRVPLSEVPDVHAEDWEARVRDWLRPRGLGFLSVGINRENFERCCGEGFFIVAGDGGRGHSHAVIYHNGKLWHDPHPDGTGIVSIESVDVIYLLSGDAVADPAEPFEPPAPYVAPPRDDEPTEVGVKWLRWFFDRVFDHGTLALMSEDWRRAAHIVEHMAEPAAESGPSDAEIEAWRIKAADTPLCQYGDTYCEACDEAFCCIAEAVALMRRNRAAACDAEIEAAGLMRLANDVVLAEADTAKANSGNSDLDRLPAEEAWQVFEKAVEDLMRRSRAESGPSDAEIEAMVAAIEDEALECYTVNRNVKRRVHQDAMRQVVRMVILRSRAAPAQQIEADSLPEIDGMVGQVSMRINFLRRRAGDRITDEDKNLIDNLRWFMQRFMQRLVQQSAAAPQPVVEALRGLVERIEQLAEFYVDLDDAPDGAVPAWDLVAIARDAAKEVLRG